MDVLVAPSKEAASELVAHRLSSRLQRKKQLCLGFATGETQKLLYAHLVAMYQRGEIDFKEVTSFNLDEYVGLDPSHPNSFHSYMATHLFSKVNIPLESRHLPSGHAKDLQRECEAYERFIQKKGPIDLQILGLGRDGHIGFNEPGTAFESRTHVQKLAPSTRHDNSRFFGSLGEVPEQAITMGIATILEAEEIFLLAFGSQKAQAVYDMVEGLVREGCPASILQTHPNVHVFLDPLSACGLSPKPYDQTQS